MQRRCVGLLLACCWTLATAGTAAAGNPIAKNFYFFIDGHMWKWIKVFDASSFGGSSFKKFSRTIRKRFGKGRVKSGSLSKWSDGTHQWLEYLDRNTRFRAVDNTSHHSKYSLTFEEMATVRTLSSVRVNSSGRSRKVQETRRGRSPVATATRTQKKKRRSIFADEGGSETDEQYEKRRKKVLARKRRAARGIYKRRQGTRKGKVLDGLDGLQDSDPLGGM